MDTTKPKMGRPAIHGASSGGKRTGTYYSWNSMRQRCLNPNCHIWPYYGGRGIDIDPRWSDFRLFLADLGEKPAGTTLERIDNSKGYWPENCKWATRKEQASNRRPRGPVPGSFKDRCRQAGMPYSVAYQRVKILGWTEQEALSDPIKPYFKRA